MPIEELLKLYSGAFDENEMLQTEQKETDPDISSVTEGKLYV